MALRLYLLTFVHIIKLPHAEQITSLESSKIGMMS